MYTKTTHSRKINRYLFIMFLFLLSMVKSIKTTIGPDYYWYIEDGKYFIEHRHPPTSNIYSFLPSKSTISYSIGFDVILYKFHSRYHEKYLYILTGIFLFFIFSLMLKLSYRPHLKIMEFLLIYLGSYLLVFWGTTLRPHLISYIFTLLFLLLYEKDNLILSIIILPFWSFFHAGVIWGIFLLLSFAVSYILQKKWKKGIAILTYAITGILLILSLNPYGSTYFTHILITLFSHTGFMGKYISEWQSLPYALISTQNPYYIASLFLILLFCVLFFKSHKKKKGLHVFLIVFTGCEAVLHVRNIPLFGLVSVWILPHYINLENLNLTISFESFNSLLHTAVFTLANILLVLVFFRTNKVEQLDPSFFPIEAVNYIKEHDGKGNILVPSDRAAFVEYHLYPKYKIAVDGRLSPSRKELIEFFKFWNMEIDPFEYVKKHNIKYIIIPKISKPLIDALLKNKSIEPVYEDQYFEVLKVMKHFKVANTQSSQYYNSKQEGVYESSYIH